MWQLLVLSILGLFVWLGHYMGVHLDFFWQGITVVGIIWYLNSDAYDNWDIFQIIPLGLCIAILIGMAVGDYRSGKFTWFNDEPKKTPIVVEVGTHYQVTEPVNEPVVPDIGEKLKAFGDYLTSKPFEKK